MDLAEFTINTMIGAAVLALGVSFMVGLIERIFNG